MEHHLHAVAKTSQRRNSFCGEVGFTGMLDGGPHRTTHLNGREGVNRGQDSRDDERWRIRLDDSTYVSAKSAN
jgi:hypothetical protein